MPNIRKIDRPRKLNIHVPTSIHEQVHNELYSEIEGRVPHGAWSQLIEVLLVKWLKERRADAQGS